MTARLVTNPPTDDDFPHLIQYTDPFTRRQRSTVLRQQHERLLLVALRANRVGSGGCPAGSLSRCDACAVTP